MRILRQNQEDLLTLERNLLNDLQMTLLSFGASKADLETLSQSIRQIDDLFLLVIVGEFNAGKSSFINALLGDNLLKEGVTPTTTQINIIRYQEEHQETITDRNILVIGAPIPLLKEISIVDTPGTNAIVRKHEEITSQFIPRSDLVLFVTSADRPLSESERAFLQQIRDWGKKLVLVLNKVDLLQNDDEVHQVENFITDNMRSLLGIQPNIFSVSSRLALQAKKGNPHLWHASHFEELETHIQNSLDETERIRLKFLNPIGVGLNLNQRYVNVIQSRLELLNEDWEVISSVERQLSLYKEDMRQDFDFRMADIENILYSMEQRGQIFFEEYLRIARIPDLLKKEKIQNAFKHEVIAEVPQQIEEKIQELIDWMVERDFRQWQAVLEHLDKRKNAHQGKIMGDNLNTSFQYNREHLIESVANRAKRVIDGYDRHIEAANIADGAQNAVAAAAAIEVGAVGLGTLIAVLASSLTVDVTGILVASAVAVLGLFVIPAKRRKANLELTKKIKMLREQLVSTLNTQFNHEMDRGLERINAAIAPYTRFVRSEKDSLDQVNEELNQLQIHLMNLEKQVKQME
ncbi:MAG: dynamin [Chloroflexi bacterium HGW-Chloroflexi-3]|nr:MAG: dynamin [Chloroflexi bacterium HGW-Chloroflexi-3]